MALRRSLLSTLCALFTCVLIGASAAPSHTRAASAVEIVASASVEADSDAAETAATRAPACARSQPATPTLHATALGPRALFPEHRERPPTLRVYLRHCAFLL
jgi:hypothetical protein